MLDTWALRGAFWLPELAVELERADAVLLLLGANSPSDWQTLEYDAAFVEADLGGAKLIELDMFSVNLHGGPQLGKSK